MYSFHTRHLSEITKLAHVKTECNYGEGVEGGTSPRVSPSVPRAGRWTGAPTVFEASGCCCTHS